MAKKSPKKTLGSWKNDKLNEIEASKKKEREIAEEMTWNIWKGNWGGQILELSTKEFQDVLFSCARPRGLFENDITEGEGTSNWWQKLTMGCVRIKRCQQTKKLIDPLIKLCNWDHGLASCRRQAKTNMPVENDYRSHTMSQLPVWLIKSTLHDQEER